MIVVNAIFGIPGSGKTTIGKLLEQNNPEFLHVSTGQIFRDIKARDEDKILVSMMNELDKTRSLYPDELTANALESYLHQMISEKKYDPINQTIILDGFPRNIIQLEMMDGKYHIDKAVELLEFYNICLDRIQNHRNLEEQRPEDANSEYLMNSMKEHDQKIQSLLQNMKIRRFEPQNIYLKKIKADRPVLEVYKDVYEFFKK